MTSMPNINTPIELRPEEMAAFTHGKIIARHFLRPQREYVPLEQLAKRSFYERDNPGFEAFCKGVLHQPKTLVVVQYSTNTIVCLLAPSPLP